MADEKVSSKKLERVYTVPFGKAYDYIRTRRTRRAVKLLRAFLSRHFKVHEEAVRISAGVNDALWRDGIQKPPRRLKVRGVLDEGKLTAWLIGEEEEYKKAQEAKKKAAEEKGKKKEAKPAEKKEEHKLQPSLKPTDAAASKPAASAAPSASAPKPAPSSSAPASKPAPSAPPAPKAVQPEPRAGDVKPMPKSSGGVSGGRKQI